MPKDIEICRRCGKVKPPPRNRSTSLCVECEAETSCKHDNHPGGLRDDDWHCAAGVHWAALVAPAEGSLTRNPCFYGSGGEKVKCDKFEPVSIEECHARDDAIDKAIARMVLADDTICRVKKEHRGEDWAGSVPCPTGCGGDLHLSHSSYNGHVWGRCTTEGCLNWME